MRSGKKEGFGSVQLSTVPCYFLLYSRKIVAKRQFLLCNSLLWCYSPYKGESERKKWWLLTLFDCWMSHAAALIRRSYYSGIIALPKGIGIYGTKVQLIWKRVGKNATKRPFSRKKPNSRHVEWIWNFLQLTFRRVRIS